MRRAKDSGNRFGNKDSYETVENDESTNAASCNTESDGRHSVDVPRNLAKITSLGSAAVGGPSWRQTLAEGITLNKGGVLDTYLDSSYTLSTRYLRR